MSDRAYTSAQTLFASLVAVFLVLPILIMIPVSFSATDVLQIPWNGTSLHWYESAFTDAKWRAALVTSLYVASMTMLASGVLGLSAAVGISNSSSGVAKGLQAFFVAPIIVPVVVFAIGIYIVLVRLHVSGSLLGLVLAHTVIATPFVTTTVNTSLQGLDVNLRSASLGLGASAIRTFYRITLPLVTSGLLSGLVLAFVISWDEVILAIFLTTPTMVTAPALIWQHVKYNITPEIAAVGTVLISVSLLLLGAAHVIRSVWSAPKH